MRHMYIFSLDASCFSWTFHLQYNHNFALHTPHIFIIIIWFFRCVSCCCCCILVKWAIFASKYYLWLSFTRSFSRSFSLSVFIPFIIFSIAMKWLKKKHTNENKHVCVRARVRNIHKKLEKRILICTHVWIHRAWLLRLLKFQWYKLHIKSALFNNKQTRPARSTLYRAHPCAQMHGREAIPANQLMLGP